MADENIERKDGRGPLDGAQTAIGAALAIGTWAAFLYNGGGGRAMSDFINRARNVLSNVGDEIAQKGLKKTINITNLQNTVAQDGSVQNGFLSRLSSAWNNAGQGVASFSLLNRTDNLFGAINELYTIKGNIDEKFVRPHFNTVFKESVNREEFFERLHITTKEDKSFINEVIDDAIESNSLRKATESIEKYDRFDAQQRDEIQKILIDLLSKKEEELDRYLENNEIAQEYDRILDDPEALRRFLERKKTAIDRFIDPNRFVASDRVATVNDILEKEDQFSDLTVLVGDEERKITDILKELVNKDSRFGELQADLNIRVDNNGEIYSLEPIQKLRDKGKKVFEDSAIGKIIKLRDFSLAKSEKAFNFIKGGSRDYFLADIEQEGATHTLSSHVRILGKTYKLDKSGKFIHVKEADNMAYISGQFGMASRIIDEMYNNNPTPPTKFDYAVSRVTKFNDRNWIRNIFEDYTNGKINLNEVLEDEKAVRQEYNRILKMNKFFNKVTRSINTRDAKKIAQNASTKRGRYWFKLASSSDDDLLRNVIDIYKNRKNGTYQNITNKDLKLFIKDYATDPQKAMQSVVIDTGGDIILSKTKAVSFVEQLRREIAKEGILSESFSDPNAIEKVAEKSGLTGNALQNFKQLNAWATIQSASDAFIKMPPMEELTRTKAALKSVYSILSPQTKEGKHTKANEDIRQTIKNLLSERASLFAKGTIEPQNVLPRKNAPAYIHLRKAINPLTDVRNINDATMWKATIKQLVAGSNDPKNVTALTMLPYFAVQRLTEVFDSFGMGPKHKDTVNVARLANFLFIKRALPIALGLTGLSYIDYRAREYTGTGIFGATANSLARLDLAKRGAIDRFGLTQKMRDARALNPISQYLNSDELEYRDYNEQLEWYQNGVTPVRQGRWWSFGSMSEYRGGKIQYFQPNYLRRAHSNYYDVSVYGSSKEKWKYSLIPTPRHPFSTVRRLLDPYFLERKHKYDRPYPISGKMFNETTPFGVVGNATIGRILKPQIRMHTAEMPKKGLDPIHMIRYINNKSKQEAELKDNRESLVTLGGIEGVAVSTYSPMDMPTGSTAILSLRMGRGSAEFIGPTGQQYLQSLPTLDKNAVKAFENEVENMDKGKARFSLSEKIKIQSAGRGIVSSIAEDIAPAIGIIRETNRNIFARAAQQPKDGIISQDSIFKTPAKISTDLLFNKEVLSDLYSLTSTSEMLKDAFYSIKELEGIWGFAADLIAPPRRSYRLAQAGEISSFSRRFWDESIGGLGGEFMEIARRFFPHEDHSRKSINPLKNTMPDWMPEKFRRGDPFTQIPKGEMRLPGAGYETLNKLHPDQYGEYGAFDRFKILADVAPWSKEYKTWRDIATRTVKDPALKKQIKKIKENVSRQTKTHEFYNYRFLGQELKTMKATIAEVDSSGAFKIMGSRQRYVLAGLKLKKGTEIEKYIHPGMTVQLQYDANKHTRKISSGAISAIVNVKDKNINRELINAKLAEPIERPTAADMQARFDRSQVARGKMLEAISHAPIPFIHDKYMRIDSPIESYQREQIYGTSYATWEHPIRGFIMPMFYRSWSSGPMAQALTLGLFAASYQAEKMNANPLLQKVIKGVATMSSPASFIGAASGVAFGLNGRWMRAGAIAGAAIGVAGHLAVNTQNPIKSTIDAAGLGALVGKYVFNNTKQGALVGAAVGFGISAIRNPYFDKDKMFGPYIPNNVKKRWEIEEYFDRLTYVKYMGLYEKAARLAQRKEGVNVKQLLILKEKQDKKREKIRKKLYKEKNKIENSLYEGSAEREELLASINEKLNAISETKLNFKAGKYTRAALAYKRAAESTIYGLRKDASYAEILRAAPKSDRDYIIEFSKEQDPKKRKEILKYMSPYKKRLLQIAWGERPSKIETNEKFFANRFMPGTFWSGWMPNVDLEKVKMRTIENEGMLLSDFGYYDSQADEAGMKNVPAFDIHQDNNGQLTLKHKLESILKGAGLIGVDVTLEQSSQNGIQVLVNIARDPTTTVKQKIGAELGIVLT